MMKSPYLLLAICCLMAAADVTGFVIPAFSRNQPARRHALELSKEQDQDTNLLISIVDSATKAATKPTPGISKLPLGYPLAFGAASLFVPWPISLQFGVTFFAFYLFAQIIFKEEDNDEDEELEQFPVNFIIAIASTLTTGLLSPPIPASAGDAPISFVVGLTLLGISVSAIVMGTETDLPPGKIPSSMQGEEEEDSPERKIMSLWDKEFENRSGNDQK